MGKRSWSWTENQFDKLSKVLEILRELEDYKPLTLRQVYDQLQVAMARSKRMFGISVSSDVSG